MFSSVGSRLAEMWQLAIQAVEGSRASSAVEKLSQPIDLGITSSLREWAYEVIDNENFWIE